MGTIRLKNMQFFAYHGVFESEKKLGAPFEVDIELKLSFDKFAQSDSLKSTIDYDAVYKVVASIISENKFNLIEKLASTIGDAIITSFNTESVVVRVRKPQAQMSGPLDTVEVELKVER